jgi:hypothetical protein
MRPLGRNGYGITVVDKRGKITRYGIAWIWESVKKTMDAWKGTVPVVVWDGWSGVGGVHYIYISWQKFSQCRVEKRSV